MNSGNNARRSDTSDAQGEGFDSNNPTPDSPRDENNNGIPDGQEDADGDGIPNEKDNAPDDYNPDQTLPGDKIFGACVEDSKLPIVAEVFRLPVNTKNLPDFSTLTKETTVCMANYDVPERDWEKGFDGLDKDLVEWFGLKTQSKLNIDEDGEYEFFLKSDDGSRLKIDGQLVIDNDGQHSARERSGKVNLSKGEHQLELLYFQGPRNRIALELFWKTPSNDNKEIVAQSNFKYPLQ
jgi:hypothetical protein